MTGLPKRGVSKGGLPRGLPKINTKNQNQTKVETKKESVQENIKKEETRKNGKKIGKCYCQTSYGDSFVEIVTDGFNLKSEEEINCKVRLNFAKLKKDKTQESFVSYFLDAVDFLYLVSLIENGVIYQLEQYSRESGEKYLPAVFEDTKVIDTETRKITRSFSMMPGRKEGKWELVCNVKENNKSTRVSVFCDENKILGLFLKCKILVEQEIQKQNI